MNNDIHNYDDIIDLPHHISKKHPPMSMYDRAAQFSSFAAIVGHSDAIAETARLTENKVILSEEEKSRIAYKIQFILEKCKNETVSITHFVADDRKTGGEYVKTNGVIKKFDEIEKNIVLLDKTKINIDDIISIQNEFSNLCE